MSDFLLTHGQNLVSIEDFTHDPKDARWGNPYNSVFRLKIRSGDFSGAADCEIDIRDFREFARKIMDLYEFRIHEVLLSEIGYGSTVKFRMDPLGHLEIGGEIFGSGMDHSLKFSFPTDQTSLKPFADSLIRFLRS